MAIPTLTWDEDIIIPTRKTQIQEVVDNVIIIENALELDGSEGHEKHVWSNDMNPFNRVLIQNDAITEIRTAVDNLKDKNYCRSHNSAFYTDHHGSYLTSYLSNYHSSYDANEWGSRG